MKLTFLQFIKRTLSAIDSQNISSAGDSPESEQVGIIVNRVYEDIIHRRDWPFLRKVGVNLVTTGSNAWELTLPVDSNTLQYITYNKKELTYKSPSEFKYMIDNRDTSISEVNSSGIRNDRDPEYWTSYDDETLTFDAYDSTYTNLLPSLCYVQYIREITSELTADSDVPELPSRFHSVMLDGVLAVAFEELKQDTGKAQLRGSEFKKGMSRMKSWARAFEESLPTYKVIDYGRNVI